MRELKKLEETTIRPNKRIFVEVEISVREGIVITSGSKGSMLVLISEEEWGVKRAFCYLQNVQIGHPSPIPHHPSHLSP